MLGLTIEQLRPLATFIQSKSREWWSLEVDTTTIIGYLASLIAEQDEESLAILFGIALMDMMSKTQEEVLDA